MHRSVSHLLVHALTPFLVVLLFGGCTTDASGPPSTPSSSSNVTNTSAESHSAPASVPSASASRGENDRTLRRRLQDATVETRVRQALVDRRRLRVFDFELESTGGRVTIRGDVNTREQHRLAEQVARATKGVTAVTNELTVNGKPPSEASSEDAADKNPTAVYHTVQPGESLWSIAREYQASVQQIKAMNDLRSGSLQVGQRIRVR